MNSKSDKQLRLSAWIENIPKEIQVRTDNLIRDDELPEFLARHIATSEVCAFTNFLVRASSNRR